MHALVVENINIPFCLTQTVCKRKKKGSQMKNVCSFNAHLFALDPQISSSALFAQWGPCQKQKKIYQHQAMSDCIEAFKLQYLLFSPSLYYRVSACNLHSYRIV